MAGRRSRSKSATPAVATPRSTSTTPATAGRIVLSCPARTRATETFGDKDMTRNGIQTVDAGASSNAIDAKGNWWGTTDAAAIGKRIEDAADDDAWGAVDFESALSAAPAPSE